MKKYGVIMAGGNGTRFWPLSRRETPKHLLNLSGKELMINEAVDRLSYTVDNKDIFIVTNVAQFESIIKATDGRISFDHVLSEPAARNTAACIGYAAIEIIKKYGDGIMIVTPSDTFIKDTAVFTRILSRAVEAAEKCDKLVTIGITPTFPSTGYGYIKYDNNEVADIKSVSEFKEKPDEKKAMAYFESGNYLWNSGMFVWKASVILKNFKRFIPDIYNDIMKIGDAMGKDNEYKLVSDIYAKIRSISVDYAVMEPCAAAKDVLVVPGDFGWNDLGSWDMMEVLHDVDENGNIVFGDAITVNTTNSIVYSNKKMITTVDIDNLIVVETSDAIMICPKNKAQDVKLITDTLEAMGRTELL